ncbi:1398_t:CDS:2 [Dentiscutata erythropus]|uniref:1398_t:CDS:1 n=1 Tax=Dentiscutata erythropus TaxID=1348616 RepID=A0A9N9HQK1_9GLOM|nr:1398_t:CDS:2 [Dentiscutata erythropus]
MLLRQEHAKTKLHNVIGGKARQYLLIFITQTSSYVGSKFPRFQIVVALTNFRLAGAISTLKGMKTPQKLRNIFISHLFVEFLALWTSYTRFPAPQVSVNFTRIRNMTDTNNDDIISLNLRFRNSQHRNVIFVIEISKNDRVSDLETRARNVLASHLPVRPNNFHLRQIYPTSAERRRMQPENDISVYFPENPNEDWIHIFVHPPLSPEE